MPKRSNDFQSLIALLTMAKSDGAIVYESVEAIETVSKEPREVDVVAFGSVAGHRTTVFIECRDWKRPQDVQWVEQARTKFDDLGANVRVLVSSSGFTKTALAKAVQYGIKTIKLGEVTPEFVGQVVNSAMRAEYHHWVSLVKKTEIVITRDGVTHQQELVGTCPVLTGDGVEVGMFDGLVEHVRQHHTRAHGDLWDESAHQGEERYGKGKFQYLARGDYPDPRFNGQKVYVKGIVDATGQGELFEIANVIVTFEAQRTVAEVPLSHGEYDGTYFSTGSGVLGDAKVQLVYTETTEGGLDVVGRIDGALATLGLKTLTKGYDADSKLSDPASP